MPFFRICSSHAFRELFSAKYMEMQMGNTLTGILAGIGNDAEAAVRNAFDLGDLRAAAQAGCKDFCGNVRRIPDGTYMRFGNDQDMGFGHRMNVTEGIRHVVLINFGRRNLSGNNGAEEAVIHNINPF